MSVVKQAQSNFGRTHIADIRIDPRARDDIPAVLKGLQYIYVNSEIRDKVFALPEGSLLSETRLDTGRPGMELWKVFVLATVKLGLGCDFDRLQELARAEWRRRKKLATKRAA